MKLNELISVLENCHDKLYSFCEDDGNRTIPWYAEARRELRRTIEFISRQRRHLSTTKVKQ